MSAMRPPMGSAFPCGQLSSRTLHLDALHGARCGESFESLAKLIKLCFVAHEGRRLGMQAVVMWVAQSAAAQGHGADVDVDPGASVRRDRSEARGLFKRPVDQLLGPAGRQTLDPRVGLACGEGFADPKLPPP
jgi:hypothetical protein